MQTWLLQVVSKWRELAEQSKWDEFVAAMLQEHYDVVYARAQLKYLTPSSSHDEDQHQPTGGSAHSDGHAPAAQLQSTSHQQNGKSSPHHADSNGNPAPAASASVVASSSTSEQQKTSSGSDETVEAAGALSHLFGGPRQKLMQQVHSKQAESTLRWHREPVADISDETYTALALRLLQEYDPAAVSQES